MAVCTHLCENKTCLNITAQSAKMKKREENKGMTLYRHVLIFARILIQTAVLKPDYYVPH